jgi:hypothetical protein
MESVNAIIARSNAILATRDYNSPPTPWVYDLIICLLTLIVIGIFAFLGLFIIRKFRNSKNEKNSSLPMYNTANSSMRNVANSRRLTITTNHHGGRKSSIYVYDEKSSLTSNPSSPPLSPNNVPEIRITFPDEQDESGRPKSGRVVIVRVGDTGVGLEPLRDEQLPAYEKETGERFHSIDMERIGGLKEKSSWS